MIRIEGIQGIGFGETKQRNGSTFRILTILTASGVVSIWLEADDRFSEPAITVRNRLRIDDANRQDQQETRP